jgi:hypothetical protein
VISWQGRRFSTGAREHCSLLSRWQAGTGA